MPDMPIDEQVDGLHVCSQAVDGEWIFTTGSTGIEAERKCYLAVKAHREGR